MVEAVNPYAPPKAHVDDVIATDSDADAVRREHIRRETSIRSIGALYYLGGGFLGLFGVLMLLAWLARDRTAFNLAAAVVFLVLAAVEIAMGRGIRRLRPWARNVITVFACIGLLGFPLGTLINAYILYLLLSKQGKRIFAPDYADIVAATPGVKYRTSVVTWIALALLVLILVGLAILATTGAGARWLPTR